MVQLRRIAHKSYEEHRVMPEGESGKHRIPDMDEAASQRWTFVCVLLPFEELAPLAGMDSAFPIGTSLTAVL